MRRAAKKANEIWFLFRIRYFEMRTLSVQGNFFMAS